MAFSAIGKDYKGVSGGFAFDHKAEFAKKTAFGSVGGDLSAKGDKFPVLAKTTYKLPQSAVLDASVTDEGKVAVTLTKTDLLLSGLTGKISATALPQPTKDVKLDLSYNFAKAPVIGGKVGLTSSANVDKNTVLSSVGWASGSLILGAEAEVDVKKSVVSKYTLGAQTTLANGGVSSALLADAKTLKLAYVQKVGGGVTAGAEFVYPLDGKAVSGTVAASAKLENGATAKAAATHKGVVSLLYSADVQKNATVTLAVQLDANKPTAVPKYGVQIKMVL